jgi:hypothetical protein
VVGGAGITSVDVARRKEVGMANDEPVVREAAVRRVNATEAMLLAALKDAERRVRPEAARNSRAS